MQSASVEGLGRTVESAVRSNPEVVAVVVVVTVVVILGTYALLRFRRPEGVTFLRAMAEKDDVAILLHPNPDPDAMSAAIGVAGLAEQVDTEATLQFSGQIRHQENRAFRTVLDLDLEQIDHVSDLTSESVILVDHNAPRGFAGAGDVLPFAVIDHHPGEGRGEVFTDVRTDYGATASILTEYYRDIGAVPVPPDQHESEVDAEYTMSSRVATGLLYGILTDTDHLTNGSCLADFDAAGYLSPGVDEDLLDRIANPQMSAEVLDAKARAIDRRNVRGPFAVSNLGELSNADAIPQAADELIQLEGITAVVVYGERNGTIYLSGRSRDDRVHMGRTLKAVVSDIPDASAGGHARMGGGQISKTNGATVPGMSSGESASGSPVTSAPPDLSIDERVFRALTGDV